jgi:phospholipid-binding lipoprotein MlaA
MSSLRRAALAAGLLALAGCAVAPDPGSLTHDPYEDTNRAVHEVNRDLDRAVYGPAARAWGEHVPGPLRTGVRNLSTHWKLPHHAIQYALQGRGVEVLETGFRFAVNTAFGLGGLIDPASEMGLPYRETGVDETLHVWGVAEGGYLEIPFGGPGTERDWSGWVLDQVLDPAFYVLPSEAASALVVLAGLDLLNERYALDPALRSILHESADSYTAQRISYLQTMRARLQGGTRIEDLEDPYADF